MRYRWRFIVLFALKASVLGPLGLVATGAVAADVSAGSSATSQARKTAPLTFFSRGDHAASALETRYSRRSGEKLDQFGYDIFRTRQNPAPDTVIGAIGTDFTLGVGDELRVTLRGQTDSSGTYRIASDGQLILERLEPIPAAGRTLGELREALQQAVSDNLIDTRAFVSLSKVRQIQVLVLGAVPNPGRYSLSAFARVVDGLSAAGGIRKNGSLRRITLYRQGWQQSIDLYALFGASGASADGQLRDGDRLVVPPIGATVAVAGAVKRPAIYELAPDTAVTTARATLERAGGALHAGGNRMIRLGFDEAGAPVTDAVATPGEAEMRDGDILLIERRRDGSDAGVTLIGPARNAGTHALARAPRLGALLTGTALERDAYPLFGVIERFRGDSLARTLIPFTPRAVVEGRFDLRLQSEDRIRLFRWREIRRAIAEDASAPLEGIAADPALRNLVRARLVSLDGAVSVPGRYPIGGPVGIPEVLQTAGGLSPRGDATRIEVAYRNPDTQSVERRLISLRENTAAAQSIQPGDALTVQTLPQQRQLGEVRISGAVVRPGVYPLLPGEKLSSLVRRAGGLRPEAYPDAAVFTRERLRRAGERRLARAVAEIDAELAALIEQPETNRNNAEIRQAQALVEELRDAPALGRMTVEADPAALRANPAEDPFLEAGDHIHYPVRDSSVRVIGEVLSPAALKHSDRLRAGDYIRQAGGTTKLADESRTFVVLPDGTAEPLRAFALDYSGRNIPPGSTIFVPRDAKPFNLLKLAGSLTNLFSQLAIGAASVAVISETR